MCVVKWWWWWWLNLHLVYNWQYADLKNANILRKLANSLSGIFPRIFSDVCCFCLRGDIIITAYIHFANLFWLCVIASNVTLDLIRPNFLWLEPRLESGKQTLRAQVKGYIGNSLILEFASQSMFFGVVNGLPLGIY